MVFLSDFRSMTNGGPGPVYHGGVPVGGSRKLIRKFFLVINFGDFNKKQSNGFDNKGAPLVNGFILLSCQLLGVRTAQHISDGLRHTMLVDICHHHKCMQVCMVV